MASKIFISYRRDDSSGSAGRVHDRLEREFGRDLLFMDVDGIPLGVNFIKVLREEVAKCDVLLAVIGANWLNAHDEHGDRRLENPSDFVRVEIATALSRDIPVIPILLDGTRIPKSDQLPQELQELAERNALDVRHTSFHVDMDRLVRGLKSVLDPVVAPVQRPAEDGTQQDVRAPTPTIDPGVADEHLEEDLRKQVAELRARGGREPESFHDQNLEQQPVPAETEGLPRHIASISNPRSGINAAATDKSSDPTTASRHAMSAPSRKRIAIGIAVILVGAVVAMLAWSKFYDKPPAAPNSAAKTPTSQKSEDRIAQEQSAAPPLASKTAPANQATSTAAATATLYEEDSKNSQGVQYPGTAIWSTEKVSPGPGLAPELAVRADIQIPAKQMTITWSLRRNSDKALPASHTIEVMFNLPAGFSGGGIGNVPGILTKDSEQAKGTPLAGVAVKVTTGFFLIGLSAVDADVQTNIRLLKQKPWFDIPLVYSSGARAILALEKGPAGDRAFADAFAAWSK